MGAKNTMNMFFAAMNEQVAPTRGYGPKTLSTPMGPFTWNDNLNVWVNTNNGMQMNNIAFQDMYAMMDYTPIGGSKDNLTNPFKITTLLFSPTTQGFDTLTPGDQAVTPTFTISGNSSPVAFKWTIVSGALGTAVIKYKKNGGAAVSWNGNTSTGATTFAAGDTLQVFVTPFGAGAGSAVIRLLNASNGDEICSNNLTIDLQV